MAEPINGILKIVDSNGIVILAFDPNDRKIVIYDKERNELAKIYGPAGNVILSSGGERRIKLEGGTGNQFLGGNGADGDLLIYSKGGNNTTFNDATIHLDGQDSSIQLRSNNKNRILIDGKRGNVSGNHIHLFPAGADIDDISSATIHIDGEEGDLKLLHADCAEFFDIQKGITVEPGTVMVFGEDGRLEACTEAYDKKVAGIISGAKGYKPGILLDSSDKDNRLPIALIGKVFCKVNADINPIAIGDLLTTCTSTGHAMKATEDRRSFGAVIGKALAPLASGRSMIPVMVSLQ